jgi:hypothetical protein
MRLMFALLLMVPVPGMAEGVVHRLSPEARAAAIDQASRQPERDTRASVLRPERVEGRAPEDAARDRRVHGEVGFSVGTGGMRSVFGSTVMPLGDTGTAAFSFSTGRFPGQVMQPGPWGEGYCFRPPYCR